MPDIECERIGDWGQLYCGDSVGVMGTLPADSVDSIVTDPPYGLEFMGKEWDKLWKTGAGKSKPGIGERQTEWPSFGMRSGANPTCKACGGRLRGGRRCRCEDPDWYVDGHEWSSSRERVSQGHAMQQWHYNWAKEALRVAKPGAFLLAFGGTRTSHRLTCAIEDAGWEIRDCLMWLYGQGFPKGHDISKAIDKLKGEERRVIGQKVRGDVQSAKERGSGYLADPANRNNEKQFGYGVENLTIPATPEAQKWDGWNPALKPGWEPIIIAMKPLDGTFAKNALKHGVAGLNIDGARITGPEPHHNYGRASGEKSFVGKGPVSITPSQGRWPSNLLFSHHPECREIGVKKVKGSLIEKPCLEPNIPGYKWGTMQQNRGVRGYGDPDGTETVPAYECAAGCPCGHVWATKELTECPECGCRKTEWVCAVKMLDEQAGELKSGERKRTHDNQNTIFGFGGGESRADSGGASRFYYCAKGSRTEREQGLKGHIPCVKCGGLDTDWHLDEKGEKVKCVRNDHPTRKPLSIMEYLCRLTQTPDGGVVLDPFMGSGTTGIACVRTGREFIGVDNDPRYVEISRLAMEAARKKKRKGFNLV